MSQAEMFWPPFLCLLPLFFFCISMSPFAHFGQFWVEIDLYRLFGAPINPLEPILEHF